MGLNQLKEKTKSLDRVLVIDKTRFSQNHQNIAIKCFESLSDKPFRNFLLKVQVIEKTHNHIYKVVLKRTYKSFVPTNISGITISHSNKEYWALLSVALRGTYITGGFAGI